MSSAFSPCVKTLLLSYNPFQSVASASRSWSFAKHGGSPALQKVTHATTFYNYSTDSNSTIFKAVPISWRVLCRLKSRDEGNDEFVKPLRVPQQWMHPFTALQESEWLRIALQKWLDDEYCPEIANEEISKHCARVYYYCLMEKQADLGEILMQMVRDLETFSFRESFHGAFSSANAAVHLITMKIQGRENTQSI